MLDDRNEGGVIDRMWGKTVEQARVPEPAEDYFDSDGPTPTHYDSRRAYHRFFLRRRAILMHDGASLGVYTKDISRTGVAIFSPVQLLPKHTASLLLPGARQVEVEVRRCRRHEEGCYECGCVFKTPNVELRELLEESLAL